MLRAPARERHERRTERTALFVYFSQEPTGRAADPACRVPAQALDFVELCPILATSDGFFFAGNMRYCAAQNLGWGTIPAVLVDIPRLPTRERALRDNGSRGEWQKDDLASLLAELTREASELDLLGFDERELQAQKLGTEGGPDGG